MENTVTYGHDVLIEVLRLYKELRCLWDNSDEFFCDQNARNTALNVIKECYANLDKDVTVKFVKKKLTYMRGAYLRERKKVERSKNNAGTSEIYSPTLWYYQYLTFLNETPNQIEYRVTRIDKNEDRERNRKERERKHKKKSRRRQANDLYEKQVKLLDATQKFFNVPGDGTSSDIFGRAVSSQLKEIPNESQRNLAENNIADLLFYAKLGKLNVDTRINLNTSSDLLFQTHHEQSPPSFQAQFSQALSPSYQAQIQHQIESPHSLSLSAPSHQIQSPQAEPQIHSHQAQIQHQIVSPHSLSFSSSPSHQIQSPQADSHEPSYRAQFENQVLSPHSYSSPNDYLQNVATNVPDNFLSEEFEIFNEFLFEELE